MGDKTYFFAKNKHCLKYNYSKYKYKRLLTKDSRETSSLEYIIITSYKVSSF